MASNKEIEMSASELDIIGKARKELINSQSALLKKDIGLSALLWILEEGDRQFLENYCRKNQVAEKELESLRQLVVASAGANAYDLYATRLYNSDPSVVKKKELVPLRIVSRTANDILIRFLEANKKEDVNAIKEDFRKDVESFLARDIYSSASLLVALSLEHSDARAKRNDILLKDRSDRRELTEKFLKTNYDKGMMVNFLKEEVGILKNLQEIISPLYKLSEKKKNEKFASTGVLDLRNFYPIDRFSCQLDSRIKEKSNEINQLTQGDKSSENVLSKLPIQQEGLLQFKESSMDLQARQEQDEYFTEAYGLMARLEASYSAYIKRNEGKIREAMKGIYDEFLGFQANNKADLLKQVKAAHGNRLAQIQKEVDELTKSTLPVEKIEAKGESDLLNVKNQISELSSKILDDLLLVVGLDVVGKEEEIKDQVKFGLLKLSLLEEGAKAQKGPLYARAYFQKYLELFLEDSNMFLNSKEGLEEEEKNLSEAEAEAKIKALYLEIEKIEKEKKSSLATKK